MYIYTVLLHEVLLQLNQNPSSLMINPIQPNTQTNREQTHPSHKSPSFGLQQTVLFRMTFSVKLKHNL